MTSQCARLDQALRVVSYDRSIEKLRSFRTSVFEVVDLLGAEFAIVRTLNGIQWNSKNFKNLPDLLAYCSLNSVQHAVCTVDSTVI